MANTKSAEKRIRVEQRRRLRNRSIMSATRTAIKKAEKAMAEGGRSEAEALLKAAISKLDRAVTKGVMHRNTAARKKSRLQRRFNETAEGATA